MLLLVRRHLHRLCLCRNLVVPSRCCVGAALSDAVALVTAYFYVRLSPSVGLFPCYCAGRVYISRQRREISPVSQSIAAVVQDVADLRRCGRLVCCYSQTLFRCPSEDKLKVQLLTGKHHHGEALRYGTRCQGITQFYLPPTRLSTNGMNRTRICLPSRKCCSFTDPGWMKG